MVMLVLIGYVPTHAKIQISFITMLKLKFVTPHLNQLKQDMEQIVPLGVLMM
jgi:hypothetical protein